MVTVNVDDEVGVQQKVEGYWDLIERLRLIYCAKRTVMTRRLL
jgi:hypothetical protein